MSFSKVIMWIVIAVAATATLMGIWWLFWMLWCWVLPQVYPTGPAGLLAPSYKLFVGCLLISSLVGRVLFGRKK